MRVVIALLVLLGLGLAGALAVMLLGLPDVAATTPHHPVVRWALHETMEASVRRRAAELPVPEDLDGAGRIRAGARGYDAMCATCHGAPGVQPDALAKGLLPPPPELAAEEEEEWSAAELFWITKHGVRMTGMPGFGPTHDDDALWDVVAFLRGLPGLSEADYGALLERGSDEAPADGHDGHDHTH